MTVEFGMSGLTAADIARLAQEQEKTLDEGLRLALERTLTFLSAATERAIERGEEMLYANPFSSARK